jgi:sugar/nucleoside kinase (ribokinase family)
VSVDLSSAADIHAFGTDRFHALLHDLRPDLIFGNEQERAAITSEIDAEWVVKRGVGGARFPEGDLPAEPVDDVVDPTGAGDALAAGYLVGGPAVALEAAARCVARVGAVPW